MADFESIFADDDVDPIEVSLPAPDGDGVITLQAYPPTGEQLMILSASMSSQSGQAAGAVMELVESVFEPEDFLAIRKRLLAKRNDPARLRIADLLEVVSQIVEASADFPTQPSSVSSPSSTTTGRRSTGRVRSPASTRVSSASAAS